MRKNNSMNSKSILLRAALSLALVNIAGATTTNYVYMTGSTAARTQVYNTLTDPGVVFTSAPNIVGQGNSTLSKCTYMLFSGSLVGDSSGAVTTIKCYWSGSEAGIADLAGSGTENFLDDSASNNSTNAGPYVSSPVDLAMTDTAVTYSLNPNAPITGAFVGVIPFKFVLEYGSLSSITNVTDAQVRYLLSGGCRASLITGNVSDTNFVYISGRDQFSGTRVNTYGITKYGIGGSCNQVEVNSSGQMVDQNPPNQVYVGTYGYSSGGSLAAQMGANLSNSQDLNTGSGAPFSVIAYLGYSDAKTALTASPTNATELSYNGVMESTTAVQEGQYGLWGNEWLYRKSTVSSQASSVYNLLSPVATGINAHADDVALIDQRHMHVNRTGPNADATHN